MPRSDLSELVLKELLGPALGQTEEVPETHVNSRYILGMVAPRKNANADIPLPFHEPSEADDAVADLSAQGRDDEIIAAPEQASDNDGGDAASTTRASLIPTSIGMTCSVAGDVRELLVTARWGRYERSDSETLVTDTGKPKKVWKRVPCGGELHRVIVKAGVIEDITPDQSCPEVLLQGKITKYDGHWLVTIFLVNAQSALEPAKADDRWLFQAEIEVKGTSDMPVFVKRTPDVDVRHEDGIDHVERAAMDMLYRDRVEFAVGHATSVHAQVSTLDPRRALSIVTRAVPEYEVPQQTPRTVQDDPRLEALVLDMKLLSETSPVDLPAMLAPLPDAYEAWISEQALRIATEPDLEQYREAAELALKHCREARERIVAGIALLSRDSAAMEAFRFCNRVMFLQRVRTIFTRNVRRKTNPVLEEIDIPKNRTWYPFQLAFVLMNLPSLADPRHAERSPAGAAADLLWFPTGGGKTEAYLGLAAFAMGIRRLQGKVNGYDGEYGVAVLMRYTLRVLTLQQFQRAAALICACEVLRREAEAAGDAIWGTEPFRIGLWVGQRTTPNTSAQADEAVRQLRGNQQWNAQHGGVGSPHQVTNCPWCGSAIDGGKNIEVESFARGRGRTLVYCSDRLGTCPFSRRQSPGEGIPLLVVDEEIYRRLPALLIATVDKFAQMPWNGKVQMLFGRVSQYCQRHGFVSPEMEDSDHRAAGLLPSTKLQPHPPLRPPDLIIQDELHLISGPLGSLTGLYETAVDELCSWELNGRRVLPKIVASTATVRRASEQVQQVFARRLAVFPPHGLDAGDNFFSLEREADEKHPGRLYLGICAPGFRSKAVMIRVYTALLAAGQKLYDDHGAAADPWMTLVGYFNSLRELGGMRRLVDDDIQARLWRMVEHGLGRRKQPNVDELTSRIDATGIPVILDRMELDFDPVKDRENDAARKARKRPPHARPIDVLLATNMISVGVDVGRLGLMVVNGQPKATAEYIQATSRVGRGTPGLVLTVYNWARPRDLSHYESFEHYHATFYKHVEALSVTPFAERALQRGLAGVLVSLVRLAAEEYNHNARAEAMDRHHAIVRRAHDAIRERAASMGVPEDVIEKQLLYLLDKWSDTAEKKKKTGANLGYKAARDGKTVNLLHPPAPGKWEAFTCLHSLRDVEQSVNLVLHPYDLQDGGEA
ncbi:MAG: DISARM system helicase DrmA [Bacteroidota bacterium]|jgi:hypothetical protein|nr:DISARM system helicase DrmA [Bacteroidota bacterium]